MRATAGTAEATVLQAAAQRWSSADPLLPAPAVPGPGCGVDMTITGATGELVAIGSCTHWQGPPDSLDLTWGAARRFELTAYCAGENVTEALDTLLARWRAHLAGVPPAAERDTAAVVTWPSRDVAGVAALLRHGLAPLATIAVRRSGAAAATVTAIAPSGVTIRRAEPADLESIVRLGLEVIRFDAQFGGVNERPSTAGALRHELSEMLAERPPWTWLAEEGGAPIAMLAAEHPDRARWIAPLAAAVGPVAYVLLAGVQAGRRAGGIGAALAAQLHAEVETSDTPVTLLHYAQVNPLSAPFWSQQGYRPLWTCWEARPAVALR